MKIWIMVSATAVLVVLTGLWLFSKIVNEESEPGITKTQYEELIVFETIDQAVDCEGELDKVYQLIEESRSCATNEDCTAIPGSHCPFGCSTPISKSHEEQVHAAIHHYYDNWGGFCGFCYSKCPPGQSVSICEDDKCTSVKMMTPRPPSPKYNEETIQGTSADH